MTYPNIVPRKKHGWEFCNENVSIWNGHPDSIQTLEQGNRRVAEWFISVLRGCRRVIDIGCGTGFPSLYLAPHVDEGGGKEANDSSGNENTFTLEKSTFLKEVSIKIVAGMGTLATGMSS